MNFFNSKLFLLSFLLYIFNLLSVSSVEAQAENRQVIEYGRAMDYLESTHLNLIWWHERPLYYVLKIENDIDGPETYVVAMSFERVPHEFTEFEARSIRERPEQSRLVEVDAETGKTKYFNTRVVLRLHEISPRTGSIKARPARILRYELRVPSSRNILNFHLDPKTQKPWERIDSETKEPIADITRWENPLFIGELEPERQRNLPPEFAALRWIQFRLNTMHPTYDTMSGDFATWPSFYSESRLKAGGWPPLEFEKINRTAQGSMIFKNLDDVLRLMKPSSCKVSLQGITQ